MKYNKKQWIVLTLAALIDIISSVVVMFWLKMFNINIGWLPFIAMFIGWNIGRITYYIVERLK